MKAYILSFNPNTLTVQELLKYLDEKTEILNWYLLFPGTVMVASNQNQTILANMISFRFPVHQFLITEANMFNTNGRLLSAAWSFINTPKSSGRWDNVSYQGLAGLLSPYNNKPKA